MAKLTAKQEKIIKSLLKLESAIEEIKKLTSYEYTDFFKVLVNSEKVDLFETITTAENLNLLGLTNADIEKVKAEKSAKASIKLEKAREARKAKKENN